MRPDEPFPLVSFGGTDYVIRVARVKSLPAEGEPDLFTSVAFVRTGTHHVPISRSFATLEEVHTALRSGFELRHRDPEVESIGTEMLAKGVARRLD